MNPSNSPRKPPAVVKKEPTTEPSLSASTTTMKRKSVSEINDERNKKKPVTESESSESPNQNPNTCRICFQLKPDSEMFNRKGCNHNYCVDCISKYLVSEINNKVVKVICPTPNCYVKLKRENVQDILPKESVDQWVLTKYVSKIALEEKTYCPFKDCAVLLVKDNVAGGNVTSCECPYCHRLFCAKCKVPWHADKNCGEFLKNVKKEEH